MVFLAVTKIIRLRHVAAVILAGVWIFLHMVKMLHHHHVPAQSTNGDLYSPAAVQAIDFVSHSSGFSTADCTICDYHLTRNADHTIAEYTIQHPSLIDTFFPDYYSSLVFAYSRSVNSRGPPSVA